MTSPLSQYGSTLAKGDVPTRPLSACFIKRSTGYEEVGALGDEFDGNAPVVPDFNPKIMWCLSAHDGVIHRMERKRTI